MSVSKCKVIGAFFAVASLAVTTQAHAMNVVVSAVSQTSDDYALAVSWSNLLAQGNGEHRLKVVENGTVKGLRLLARNRVDVAVIGAPHYLDAVQGEGSFSEDSESIRKSYGNLKALFSISTSAGQYVVKDGIGINSFADLKGRSLAVGRPGGNAGRVSEAFLSAHELEPGKDVDTQYINYTDAFNLMSNNKLEGTFIWGGLPQAAIDSASRTMELRFVYPSPDKMSEFRENMTAGEYYHLKKITEKEIKEAYGDRVKVDGDVYFWTFPFMFVVSDKMDEQTAYELTRSLWDNLDEIKKTSNALALLRREEAIVGVTADLHPGAERYFREIGLIQ